MAVVNGQMGIYIRKKYLTGRYVKSAMKFWERNRIMITIMNA